MCKQIDKSTPLGKLLSSLLGLNCYTSKDGTTGTCDPKHIFKRFETLLRCIAGFMINDANIKPSDIVDQLALLPNMSIEKAHQLLDPSDKQNVPKAVTLVQSLLQLKNLHASPNPTINRCRHAIVFVAEMMGYFMRPFITVSMTLSEQVRSLATYSFLAAAVQIIHGTACLTGPLYADSQATVKNIIFTIARMQVIDPDLLFYILLEGTDRLEGLFGNCRTQNHARNFDIEQLSGKLSVATLINTAMESNPDLDKGHRRLSLKGAMGVDHVNPKSWTGNVCVGDVDLNTEWKQGQADAEQILQKFFGRGGVDFASVFSKSGHDLLRPLGEYVGVTVTEDDARSEEEDPVPLFVVEEASEPTTPVVQSNTALEEQSVDDPSLTHEADADDSADAPLGMDFDDFLPDTAEALEENVEPEAISKTLIVDGKEFLKSSIVASLSSNRSKKVTMRTLRVRGVALEDLRNSRSDELDPENMEDGDYIKKGDLAATLV
jgi:hypothetical protein